MALVPPGVVTVTSTIPAASAGDTAVIDFAEFTVKLVASVEPNLSARAMTRMIRRAGRWILTLAPDLVDAEA
jgi:hypothetical protein